MPSYTRPNAYSQNYCRELSAYEKREKYFLEKEIEERIRRDMERQAAARGIHLTL